MDEELRLVYEPIMQAVSAEEVFGVTNVTLPIEQMLAYLEKEYGPLKEIVNPDRWTNPEDSEMAGDAELRLDLFYGKAQARIKDGTFGLGGLNSPSITRGPSFVTSKRKYYLGNVLAEGDIATLYNGYCEIGDEVAGEVIIKLCNEVTDNDLMQNEIRILEALHDQSAPQWKHLPVLLDNFRTDGRIGIVLRQFHGYTIDEVRAHRRYLNGVDRKHMVWMLNRALSCLGYVHNVIGAVHCNIEPGNYMIRPYDHNGCLIDWIGGALHPIHTGDGFRMYTEHFSPPEVEKKESPVPATDIYSIGKVMIYVLNGNVETNEMPDSVEPELQRLLKWMVRRSQFQRPQNAWELHTQLITTIEDLWGPREFLPFIMD